MILELIIDEQILKIFHVKDVGFLCKFTQNNKDSFFINEEKYLLFLIKKIIEIDININIKLLDNKTIVMSEVLVDEDDFDEDDEQLKNEVFIIIFDYIQLLKNINNDKNNKLYKQLLIEKTNNDITQNFPPEIVEYILNFTK